MLLETLQNHSYPEVPSPSACRKRASVALIVRIRATIPSSTASISESSDPPKIKSFNDLKSFFGQDWVRYGYPEVLFIKRASRIGDRWAGHVAFPGGKRELDDEDDRATCVRETMEEIGIDLSASHSLFVGNLPQQIVTTALGKVPSVQSISHMMSQH